MSLPNGLAIKVKTRQVRHCARLLLGKMPSTVMYDEM